MKDFNTVLAQEAYKNTKRFKKYCQEEEFKTLIDGIYDFDRYMTGCDKFNQIQAKVKLEKISLMDFEMFCSVMFVYFVKAPKDLINLSKKIAL